MNKIILFTFGYYGWGSWTPQLVEAVDAVETSRCFEPPIFVDIRIRRMSEPRVSWEAPSRNFWGRPDIAG